MAITTRDALIAALGTGQNIDLFKSALTGQTAGRYISTLRVGGRPGPSTTTPTVSGNTLSSASAGAIPFTNPTGSNTMYVGQIMMTASSQGVGLLLDGMVETGGLSGIVTTAQTVNTVALPARGGTGVGVTVGLVCYTATGGTAASTVTISYTNSAGVTGRTGTVSGGIPASWAQHQILPVTLASGDAGVQSVQSVTIGSSTGTAGNFGLMMYRRIMEINLLPLGSTAYGWAETGLPIISADACLAFAVLPSGTTSPQIIGSMNFIQG